MKESLSRRNEIADLVKENISNSKAYVRIPANTLAMWCFIHASPTERVNVMLAAINSRVITERSLRVPALTQYLTLSGVRDNMRATHLKRTALLRKMRYELLSKKCRYPVFSRRVHLLLSVVTAGIFSADDYGFSTYDQYITLRNCLAFPKLLPPANSIIPVECILPSPPTTFRKALVLLKELDSVVEGIPDTAENSPQDEEAGIRAVTGKILLALESETIATLSEL